MDPNASNLNSYDVRAYRSGMVCVVSGYVNPKANGGGLNLLTIGGVEPLGGRYCGTASSYGGTGSKCYAARHEAGGAVIVSFDIPVAGGDYNFLVVFPYA